MSAVCTAVCTVLGVLVVLVLIVATIGWGINELTRTGRILRLTVDYLAHRKEFKRWLEEREPRPQAGGQAKS